MIDNKQTIAVHCENICNGGIQRVVVKVLELLHRTPGYKFVLLTDQAPDADDYDIPDGVVRYELPDVGIKRTECLQKILQTEKVSIFWEHNYYTDYQLEHDLALCKNLNIKVILHHHSVFSSMIARGNNRTIKLFDIYKNFADAMLVLSHADETFFRLLDIPAFYMPNPMTFKIAAADFNASSNNILWIGRIVYNKQPLHAVKIMQKVLQHLPDVTMTIVGDGQDIDVEEVREYIAANDLGNNITLAGFQKDVSRYYKNTGLLLMTTQFEGFPMTVLESKAFGVPIINYDMPYLETLQPDTGAISVPQEDIAGAAEVIVRLFSDPERKDLKHLSQLARKSYEEFAAFDLYKAYDNFFSLPDYSYPEQTTYSADEIRPLFNTMFFHHKIGCGVLKKHFYRAGAKDKRDEITSGLTWRLGHFILWLPQMLFKLLKGGRNA